MITVHTDATPLELIERTVLEQAKGIDLDLDDDAARARMRDLITDAVARWSADYRRGLRTHDLADPELLAASNPGQAVLSPVFLPERKQLDEVLRDGVALPDAVVAPISQAVQARLEALDNRTPAPGADEPVLVEAGSLGAWDEEVAG